MAIRTFRSIDGTTWMVWRTQVAPSTLMPNSPLEWLTFQTDGGTERRRLMQIPASWFDLSDERLDLLRRVAEPVSAFTERHSPPGGNETVDADSRD